MCFLPTDFLTDTPTLENVQLRFCRFKSITGECAAANIANFAFQGNFSNGHYPLINYSRSNGLKLLKSTW